MTKQSSVRTNEPVEFGADSAKCDSAYFFVSRQFRKFRKFWWGSESSISGVRTLDGWEESANSSSVLWCLSHPPPPTKSMYYDVSITLHLGPCRWIRASQWWKKWFCQLLAHIKSGKAIGCKSWSQGFWFYCKCQKLALRVAARQQTQYFVLGNLEELTIKLTLL